MTSYMDALGAARSFASGLPDPSALLASFASAFTQDRQPLKLHFSTDAGIPEGTLLPHRLTGHEGINLGLRLELEVLSSDASLELKTLLGAAVQVAIVTDAGDEREVSGLITEAHQEGGDGGFAAYRLVIEDGLSVLRLARGARVAMNVNVLDLTERILRAHLDANPTLAAAFQVDNRCRATYPERPFWLQFGETDFDYLRRVWAREGISFVVMNAAGSTPDHPQHVLTLFDDPMDLDENAAGAVRFHRSDSSETSDTITEWNGRRSLQSGSVSRSAWNHDTASLAMATEESQARQGDGAAYLSSTLEDYVHEPSLEGESTEAVSASAKRRMQAREGWAKRFDGSGTVRHFAAGTWFSLIEHPVHDQDTPRDREFVLANVDVEAVNNLPKDLAAGLSGLLSPKSTKPVETYRNRFVCIRRGIPILPAEIDPPDPGLLTATVAGPNGEVVHTDELGRIKVTFHFARPGDHPEAGATGTDADSAWIRQMETSSSQGFGATFVPRVGDEVVVQFLGGDPDRPLIIGSLSNGASPATAFGALSSLPGDKALSGFRSRMHGGFTGNELTFDDTQNQLRAKLASDHAQSQLQLGHLVHPRQGGVGEARGEGFDLRTEAYGVARADKGLLISTTGSADHHLDAQDLDGALQATLDLSKALSDASDQHQAAKLGATDTVKGMKDSLAKTKKMKDQEVIAFGDPILAMTSPAGIVSGTPGSHVLHAGEHLALSSGKDTNLGVGSKLTMAVKEAWSVFVAKSGIKLFVGKGDIAIQAHDGNVQVISDKDATLTACTKGVELAAKNTLTLGADGGKVELKGGNLNIFANVIINAKLSIAPGSGIDVAMPSLPKGDVKPGDMEICHLYHDEEGVQGSRFEAHLADGSVRKGTTDQKGIARLTQVPPGAVKVMFEPDSRTFDRKDKQKNPRQGQDLDEVIARYAPPEPKSKPRESTE